MRTIGKIISKRLRQTIGIVVLLFFVNAVPIIGAIQPIKIGVLANRGRFECMQRWSPTATYLSRAIDGYKFTIVPLLFDEIEQAVRQGKLDFVLTNPSIYVNLEIRFDANRIATLKNMRLGKPYTEFGGVIFYRSDRSDIRSLDDLRGQSFVAVNENALGGWQAAWFKFKKDGINPYEDFSSLKFSGTQDEAIFAVRDGVADAGTVRTDALELLAETGEINIENFKIFPHRDHKKSEIFPLLHSTNLYPEWPFARIGPVADSLVQKVAIALLEMPPSSSAAKAAKCAGWSVPLSYQPVRDCLKILKIGPFKHYGETTIVQFILQNKLLTVLVIIILMIVLGFLIGVIRLNKRLHLAKQKIEQELQERKQLEIQLGQAQKLEAIGQLAAGIAHEINTPSQFINDNLTFLKTAFEDLGAVVSVFQQTKENYQNGKNVKKDIRKIEEVIESSDLEFLEEEVPQALEQSLQGIDRIRKIVKAMKEFSHPSTEEKKLSDINRAIENTVIVSANEWKYVADLKTELDESLPLLPCYVDEFNQVVLNMIVNAAHAIGDVVGDSGEKGTITIKTMRNGSYAEVRICDTGTGIPKNIQHRVFDPFFTTKEVGKGTGQGLAISYDVIVNKHGGELMVESKPGKGTTFIIRIPMDHGKTKEKDG